MKQLKDIIKNHNFTFSKRYGQNFLSDPQLLDAISRDGAESGDTVLEIGAGAGTLTRSLCDMGARVTAFEIDERLRPILAETLEGCDARVIFADAMEYPIDELDLGKYRLVANLPYYITTPIIFRFLYDPDLLSLTVMVQKEVAERICAKAGTPEYGALSAQMQIMGQVKIVRSVPRNMFVPSPDVDSAVVRLDISPRCDRSELPLYRRVVAAAFAMRRKTLVNNLMAAFALSRTDAEPIVEKVCGDKGVRGEKLDAMKFLELARVIAEHTNR